MTGPPVPTPPPLPVNADAQGRARDLKSIVGSAQLLGGCFLCFGLLLLFPATRRRRWVDPTLLFIASSLMSSGVLYVVFASFLKRRRYWAWVATLVMTILLLAVVTSFAGWVAYSVARDVGREPAPGRVFLLAMLGPGVWLGTWIAALVLILRYLRRSLPAVREEESVVQKGFAVVPLAQLAPAVPPGRAPESGPGAMAPD